MNWQQEAKSSSHDQPNPDQGERNDDTVSLFFEGTDDERPHKAPEIPDGVDQSHDRTEHVTGQRF